MSKHFAWRPHLDRDPLFNPFIPSERGHKLHSIELAEAYGDEGEVEDSAPSAEAPSEEGKEPSPAK
jgi:hypothetical protein